jgi:opacity protein-like surface antigen
MKTGWWAAVLIATFPCAAAAQQEPAPRLLSAQNVYVGGSWGVSKYKDACRAVPGCDANDPALRLLAGLQLSRIFALEGGYHNLGQVRAQQGSYIRSNAWEGLVVAAVPFSQRWGLYGKLGAYRVNQEGGGSFAAEKKATAGITYGGGLQYTLNNNVSLRWEWQDYPHVGGTTRLPKGDINVFSVGALWRFR